MNLGNIIEKIMMSISFMIPLIILFSVMAVTMNMFSGSIFNIDYDKKRKIDKEEIKKAILKMNSPNMEEIYTKFNLTYEIFIDNFENNNPAYKSNLIDMKKIIKEMECL